MTVRLADELAGRVKPVVRKKPEPVVPVRQTIRPDCVRRARALARLGIAYRVIGEAMGMTQNMVGDIATMRSHRLAGLPSDREIHSAARFMARYVVAKAKP